MVKAKKAGKFFAVIADFLKPQKLNNNYFLTNFKIAILCAIIYTKSCFHSCQKLTR